MNGLQRPAVVYRKNYVRCLISSPFMNGLIPPTLPKCIEQLNWTFTFTVGGSYVRTCCILVLDVIQRPAVVYIGKTMYDV